MKKVFSLKFKDDLNVSPFEVMENNVHALEKLCKQANEENFQVVLYSPDAFTKPQNVYELSAILAEDMVLKYNENNIIARKIDDCK